MYSQSAGQPQQIRIESKRGGAYKPRAHHFNIHDFEQEYTEKEREQLHDFYADGYEFAERGGELWKMPVDLNIHGKGSADNRRLFRLGVKDYKEQNNVKA